MLFTQEYSRICDIAEQDGRRRRRKKRQAEKRTSRLIADDFLNYQFTPIINREVGLLGHPTKVANDFYQSLNNLVTFYHLKVNTNSGLCYPHNIVESFNKVKAAFGKQVKDLNLAIIQDEKHKACVATTKEYDTGYTLFYLPVRPLLTLMQYRQKRQQANLLLSMFAYLYQVAGIPYFTNCFLGGEYEMIHDWYTDATDDYDEDLFIEVMETYRLMDHFGKRFLKSIRHPYHLQQFEDRVKAFKPRNESEQGLKEVSQCLLNLYQRHPHRSITDNLPNGFIETGDEDVIQPDEYISFFWDDRGTLYEQLIETVNQRFQETTNLLEPMAIQLFDKIPSKEEHSLDFEADFFDCLHDLADVLNRLP